LIFIHIALCWFACQAYYKRRSIPGKRKFIMFLY
jgi:hypothetical protein